MGLESRSRWAAYSEAKDEMFAYTDTTCNPWWGGNSDNKQNARLNFISHFLSQIDDQTLADTEIALAELNKKAQDKYLRAPLDSQNFVPEKYWLISLRNKGLVVNLDGCSAAHCHQADTLSRPLALRHNDQRLCPSS